MNRIFRKSFKLQQLWAFKLSLLTGKLFGPGKKKQTIVPKLFILIIIAIIALLFNIRDNDQIASYFFRMDTHGRHYQRMKHEFQKIRSRHERDLRTIQSTSSIFQRIP